MFIDMIANIEWSTCFSRVRWGIQPLNAGTLFSALLPDWLLGRGGAMNKRSRHQKRQK
jgi:hypothetical protein